MRIRSKSARISLGAVVIVLIIGVGWNLTHSKSAVAAWMDENWLYRKAVPITNTGSVQTDFQVQVTLDTQTLATNGKIQTSCNDLRVTDINGKQIPFWIEPTTCNTTTTKIWVKVPAILVDTGGSTAQTVYLYYGNPSAASGQAQTSQVFVREISNLQGGWNMDEASWTNDCSTASVLDSSGNGNNGKACPNSTGPTGGATGKFNNGGTIDGTDDNINIGNPAASQITGALTLAAWVNMTDSAAHKTIIAKDTSGDRGYNLNVRGSGGYDNKVGFMIGSTTTARTARYSSDNFSFGSWVFVVGVFDPGSRQDIYINGVKNNGDIDAAIPSAISPTATNLLLGNDGYGEPVNSTLDELMVYNKALSDSEISDIYGTGGDRQSYVTTNYANKVLVRKFSSSVAVGTLATEEQGTGPVGYWSFDDGQGTVAQDKSSSNNDGTLGGTTIPAWQTEDVCVSGKCLFFDGSTSKVTGSKIAYGIQTISFWIKPNTIATQGLFNLDGGTHKISTDASGVISATGFTSPAYYINGVLKTTPTLTLNQWNHVSITTATGFNSTNSFTIGTDGTNFIKGFIDDVKFYPYARTAAQIKTDFVSRSSRIGQSVQIGPQNQWISQGLVGYWKMDESSWTGSAGEVIDSSGNSNNGTSACLGDGCSVATTAAGKFGNAGTFNDTNYASVTRTTALEPTTAITLAGWINVNNFTKLSLIIGKQHDGAAGTCSGGGNASYALYFNTNQTAAFSVYGTSAGTLTSTSTYSAGTWYHLTGTFSGSTITLYVNGAQVATGTFTGPITHNTGSGYDVFLGKWCPLISTFGLNGKTDETRIYNRALSPKEVSDLYNFAPGPQVQLKMDEGTGTSANDTSGNGRTGTLNGNPVWAPGKYGAGVKLDGTGDNVSVPDFGY